MKKLLIIYLLMNTCTSQSQKETFDNVSYTTPIGWEVSKKEKTIAFTKEDTTNGTFSIITLYKTLDASTDAKQNFDDSWESLVKETFTNAKPEMQPYAEENGWTVHSGYATFEKEGVSGIVMLVSATGNSKLVNFLILTNTDVYEKDVTAFLESVELEKPMSSENEQPTSVTTINTDNSPIVGLWGFYNSESYGTVFTGGYFRKEYQFYADGTYLYRRKDWSNTVKDIIFAYETGTYMVRGNQLTISPSVGKKEWWSKAASKRTNEWGNREKTENQTLEKITYTFELKYLSGMDANYLFLTYGKPSERDGKQSNQNNSLNEFRYKQVELNKSLIDNPPGTTIALHKK